MSNLVVGIDSHEMDDFLLNLVANQVAVHFDMLCAFMKDGICSDVYGVLVVVVNVDLMGVRDVEVVQKIEDPLGFTRSVGQGAILCFRRRTENNNLFLGFPTHQIVSKKKSESNYGPYCEGACSPV